GIRDYKVTGVQTCALPISPVPEHAGQCEIANLLSVEQAISARAATHTLDESEFLIEADCVHADFGQLCGLTDVNDLRHVWKDKPWSSVQSHEEIVGLESVMDELERTVTAEWTNAADT